MQTPVKGATLIISKAIGNGNTIIYPLYFIISAISTYEQFKRLLQSAIKLDMKVLLSKLIVHVYCLILIDLFN